MQQDKLILKEIQRWCKVEVNQSISPDDFDSLEDWKIGVGFNSTKCKIFHFSSDTNVLCAPSLEAINEGGGAEKIKKKQNQGLLGIHQQP